MEYQKMINLLDNIPDKVPKFTAKKCIEGHDQSKIYNTNKYDLKHPCSGQIYVIILMHILLLKDILLFKQKIIEPLMGIIEIQYLILMHHLLIAYQK